MTGPRPLRPDCEEDLRRCLAEQEACADSLRTGISPSWHPRAGEPMSDTDRREAWRGLSDWIWEECEVLLEAAR